MAKLPRALRAIPYILSLIDHRSKSMKFRKAVRANDCLALSPNTVNLVIIRKDQARGHFVAQNAQSLQKYHSAAIDVGEIV